MNKLPPLNEHQIQAGFFREASHEFRNDPTFRPILFYAVLNGAWIAGGDGENKKQDQRRKAGLIQKYKDEGWRSGVADMMYDQPRGIFNKCVIEFKKESKRNTGKRSGMITGGLEPDQIEYLKAIAPYAFIRVCYSEEEGMSAFRYYMSLGESVLPAILLRESVEYSVENILSGMVYTVEAQ